MGTRNGSYLRPGNEALAAQKKAARNSVWSGVHANCIDADEPVDPVTIVDYSTPDHIVPDKPRVCLGLQCPLKWDVCDRCKLNKN